MTPYLRHNGPVAKTPYLGPGARKEALRRRHYPAQAPRRRRSTLPYVELHACSAFSFLDGASDPEDLVQRATELELPAVALLDRSGVYGAPRFHKAAGEAGLRALVGAEVVLADRSEKSRRGKIGRREAAVRALEGRRLALLVQNREGYANLCKLLTAAARGRPKGDARVDEDMLRRHAAGLWCLTGGDEGVVAHTLGEQGLEATHRLVDRLQHLFDGRLHVELQRHYVKAEEQRNRALLDIAGRLRLPVVATNGVRYAHPDDKPLHDVLTCARYYTSIDEAGNRLALQRDRYLKSARHMAELFADLPHAVEASAELAERLDFTLADLGYRFPAYPVPDGETLSSFLRRMTWTEARARFRPLTARAQQQIAKELDMIEKLELSGYFLIVWDIIRFCKRHGIFAQGRGSAANSAVCYALSITAVDPVKMDLLFERFLSEERGEWPDIDLDLPSGEPREKVIQYVYERYGPHGAAMTANVITYRDRLAAREVGKALGFDLEQVGKLSKRLGRLRYDQRRGDERALDAELRAVDLDPDDLRVRHFVKLWQRIQNLPRHLGQHSGGMILAHGRLDEVVPLEPASMPGRTVIQWDKEDCADLGIIKVDLLGLGMLNALEEAVPLILEHQGRHVDYAHIDYEDPAVFDLLQRADTVGVFQVESRAQMASLPRNRPERFYDLVIQVAIIRPGPIVGGMVHPFFDRRQGRKPVDYLHPSLKPILERTLGVPLFQEQLLRIAMVAAGFSGGEAEELRRAMGFKRSTERMESIERRLREGMAERGIVGATQDQIVQSITSFALYGFPESHAASFALIAYASAWLKVHHPTAFYISLLNAWPMGFYHPATLIQDAKRRGVRVLPIDVTRSSRRCTWEDRMPKDEARPDGLLIDRRVPRSREPQADGMIRLGLRYVRGLSSDAAERIERERERRPFRSVDELAVRCRLDAATLDRLAFAGALAGFGLERREALWQASKAARPAGPLFQQVEWDGDAAPSPLPAMSALENLAADFYSTGLTTGRHPMAFARADLRRQGILTCADLGTTPAGRQVRFAGSVIVRQRPGTAHGMLFVTLEDETGMAQALVTPDLLAKNREVIVASGGLVVEGLLQRRDGSMSVKASRVWPIERLEKTPSHDWH